MTRLDIGNQIGEGTLALASTAVAVCAGRVDRLPLDWITRQCGYPGGPFRRGHPRPLGLHPSLLFTVADGFCRSARLLDLPQAHRRLLAQKMVDGQRECQSAQE